MAGPFPHWLSLCGMVANESPNSRRDLVVPHTTAQSHDTDGGAGQPPNVEERLPVLTPRKKQKK